MVPTTIRMTIRDKINEWLDAAEARGMETYGKSLEEANDGRDWRDELIQELVDGLQYAAKEIKEITKLVEKLQEELKTPFDD